MILRPAVFASCVTLAAFALAGCSGGDDEGVVDQVSSAVETAKEAIPETIEVELAEVDSSRQYGTATLEPNDDGTLNVTIELSGGSEGPQPAYIYHESCAALGDRTPLEIGALIGVAAPLNDVVNGTSTSEHIEFSLDDVLPTVTSPGPSIMVHKSAAGRGLETYVACGDITDLSLP